MPLLLLLLLWLSAERIVFAALGRQCTPALPGVLLAFLAIGGGANDRDLPHSFNIEEIELFVGDGPFFRF